MATSTQTPVRFGIIGCADIARKLCRAIDLAPNAVLSAVASRSLEKAASFARANNCSTEVKIYGSYEGVIEDPTIDAIYLPLPTSLHVKWALKVAQSKKHLLMEKPVAMNVQKFDEIAKACEENGVQFMDGTMWVHHPRNAKMREFLDDTELFGQLKRVFNFFFFNGNFISLLKIKI